MRETKIKKKIRRERRRDEESLYYILERDMDRDAIFSFNNGWKPQMPLGHGRIDYVVKYRDKLLGIEVKCNVPDLRHFEQAERYLKYVDAIFLAYPSDRVAEAKILSERKPKYQRVGLISVTLYRTHCISPATTSGRESSKIWNEFDETEYYQAIKKNKTWGRSQKLARLIGTILREHGPLVSVGKSGEVIGDDEEADILKLTPKEWKSLAVLYALTKTEVLFRSFTMEHLDEIQKRLGWSYADYQFLSSVGIIDSYTYGIGLWVCAFPEEFDYCEKEFVKAVREVIGKNEWKKLMEFSDEWKTEFIERQKSCEKDFLKS